MGEVMRMERVLACVLSVCATGIAADLVPVRNNERILWVGNSFSDWFGPITPALGAAFRAAGAPSGVTFHQVVRGMGTFQVYYTETELHVLDSIRSGHFDRLVLQGYQDAYKGTDEGDVASFLNYGVLFCNEAHAQDMEVVLFCPQLEGWEWEDNKWQIALNNYATVASSGDASVAPAILAWKRVVEEKGVDAARSLLYHDWQHQNGNGMLLNIGKQRACALPDGDAERGSCRAAMQCQISGEWETVGARRSILG